MRGILFVSLAVLDIVCFHVCVGYCLSLLRVDVVSGAALDIIFLSGCAGHIWFVCVAVLNVLYLYGCAGYILFVSVTVLDMY